MKSLAHRVYTHEGKQFAANEGETIYNLGCGEKKYPGVIGVDVREGDAVQCVVDLNKTPWPIETGSADGVVSFHTMEHLADLNAVMGEIYRILKPGGRFLMEVPYFRHPGAFQDPTHTHFFTSRTMEYFCENDKRTSARYSSVRFKMIGTWLGWPVPSRNPIVQSVKRWVNTHKDAYDVFWSMFFPVSIVVVELEALK